MHQAKRPEFGGYSPLSERPAAKIDVSLVGNSKAEINKKLADRAVSKRKGDVGRAVEIVKEKAEGKRPKKKKDKYIMKAFIPVEAYEEKEYSETIYNTVPQATEYATLELGGAIIGLDYLPWSPAPVGYSIPFLPAALGALLIKAGGQLLASIAMEVTVGLVELGISKARRIQLQLHTGVGTERYPGFTDAVREGITSKDSNSDWTKSTDWETS